MNLLGRYGIRAGWSVAPAPIIGGGTTPTSRAPYPTGLPSIAYANGTYTATDAPFSGDGTITVSRRWLLDGVSVGTGATLADSSTIQAGKVLVLENDATSSTTGAATVKPVSNPFIIATGASLDLNLTKPVIAQSGRTVTLTSQGGLNVTGTAAVIQGETLSLLLDGASIDDRGAFPVPVEYEETTKSVVARLTGKVTLDGVTLDYAVDSDPVVLSIVDDRAPFLITASVLTGGRTVNSDVQRSVSEWGPAAATKTFSHRFVDVPTASLLTDEYLNANAGVLRAGDVVLNTNGAPVQRIPSSMETPAEDRSLQRVTACTIAGRGTTYSVSNAIGPVVLSDTSPITLSVSTLAENVASGSLVSVNSGRTPGSTLTLDGAGGRFVLSADGSETRIGLVPLDYDTATEISTGVRGYRLTYSEQIGSGAVTTSIVDIAVTEVVSFTIANSMTQNGVNFSWGGIARRIERNFDGSCTVIVPDGATISVLAPVPASSGSGIALRNGFMVNPSRGTSSSVGKLAFDGRTPAFDANKVASFPQVLGAGTIITGGPSAPEGTTKRQGYQAEAATLYIINETQAAAMPAPFAEMIPPSAFRGTYTLPWRRAYSSDVMAFRKNLSTVGLNKPTQLAAIRTRMARYNPLLMATVGNGDTGGYEDLSINGYGNAISAGGNSNYGAQIGESFATLALDFLSDAADADVLPYVKAWIALGSQHFDLNEAEARTEYVDGGHFQFWPYLDLFGLIGTKRSARIADLPTVSPQNQLSQAFRFTSSDVAALAPHTSDARPFTSRLRTISAISGLNITIPGALDSGVNKGDPYHIRLFGLQCRRADGTLIGTVTSNASSKGASSFTVTLSAATGLAVGNQVYFTAPYTIAVGDAAWRVRKDLGSYNPSTAAEYRSVQAWEAFDLLIHGLGLKAGGVFSAMSGVVLEAVAGTKGMPRQSGNYSPDQASAIGWYAYVRAFSDRHRVTLGVVSTLPAEMRIAFGPAQSNMKYPSNTNKGSTIWAHPNMDAYRPTLDDDTQAVFIGRNDNVTPSRVFNMPVTTANGKRTSSHVDGMVPLAVMLIVQWWQKKWPTIKLKLLDLSRSGVGPAALLDNDETTWQLSEVKAVLDEAAVEPDLAITKWAWASGFTKPQYLRVAPSTEPASTPGTAITLPYATGGQDESFWDIKATAGTKDSTPPPLFSTKTKLAIVPEDSESLRNRLKNMMLDVDWQTILQRKFLGRWDGIAADGGHPYSNILSGHALWAHKAILPHIAAFMFSKGYIDKDVFEPGQQQFVTYSDGNTKARIHVRLVNDGVLQVPRSVWGVANSGTALEDGQAVNWVFIQRSGEADAAITPIMAVGSTAPASHQGTVTIEDTGKTIASVTLANGDVVENGRWGVILYETLSTNPLVAGDKIHTGRNWWGPDAGSNGKNWGWIDRGGGEAAGPVQQPALDIPTESVPHINFTGLILPFAGMDLAKYHAPHVVVSGPADTTAPVLSAPTDNANGAAGGLGTVSTDEGAGTLYVAATAGLSSAAPTAAQIIAGTGGGIVAANSKAITASGSQSIGVTGQSASTSYRLHFVQRDAATSPNTSNVVSGDGYTTGAADTTAPNLTLPTDEPNGATAMTGTVTTNEGNGTLYVRRRTGTTVSTQAQLLATTGQAVTASGVQNVAGGGLTASTAYVTDYLHVDAAGNPSTIVSADGFTTAAAPTISPFVSAANATFVDPNNPGAGVTGFRFKTKLRSPTAAALTTSSGRTIYWQGGGGFQTWLQRNSTGAATIYVGALEDGAGTAITVSGTGQTLNDNTFGVHEVKVDYLAGTLVTSLDGANVKTINFTVPSNAFIQPTQKFQLLTNGSQSLGAGYEFEYIEIYFTKDGVEALYKRIEGPAATANADAWKSGTASFT